MDRKSDKTLGRALANLQAGRLGDAERDLKAVLRKGPRHVGVLNLLGVLHTRQGRFADTETFINRAIAAGSIGRDIH
jgi:Flp pilus assembly protein TadD